MISNQLDFDYQKATQAINYFARKEASCNGDKLKIIKLIWLTDRYHLRKYGRPVIGDEYIAMPLGPVGSGVKDIIEQSSFAAKEEISYAKKYIKPVSRTIVESFKEVDFDVFSKTDIESLEFAYNNFGAFDAIKLARITHKYPEWKKYEAILDSGQSTREVMDYLDFFEDSNQLSDDKFKTDKNLLQESKETFIETIKLQTSL